MALIASSMANFIISNIYQVTDATEANSKFYKALCDYVEANAQVFYSWTAALTSTPFTPDPMVIIQATIKTAGTLTPSGANEPGSALSIFSANLNANAATWMITWPPGFSLSPAFIIPTINITPSMATEQQSAMIHVCQEIIDGIKKATPVASGSHASFVGVASFTQIL